MLLKFFYDINCVNYILSYEQFLIYTLAAYKRNTSLLHIVWMLLCLILSFDRRYKGYFDKVYYYVDYVLKEGSLASIEALILTIKDGLYRVSK